MLTNNEVHYSIINSKKHIRSLIEKFKKDHKIVLSNTLFCIEQTGSYSNILLFFLAELSTNIWLETPLRIKQSSGVNGLKSEKAPQ